MQSKAQQDYWRAHLRLLAVLLSVWFLASFGAGILLVDWLNHIQLGGFKLGFWFAQQGGIYTFIALIFVYAWRMRRLEQTYAQHSADSDEQRGQNGGSEEPKP